MTIDTTNHQAEFSFHEACKVGSQERVTSALNCGHHPNDSDLRGRSALSYAFQYKNREVCLILLKKGGSLNQLDQDGLSPLYHASKTGVLSFDLLKRYGADFSQKAPNGETLYTVILDRCEDKIAGIIGDFLENCQN